MEGNKSAKWISKGVAEITFDVSSVINTDSKYTDVLLVLDVSGSMGGNKLDKVKSDSVELINSLLSDNKNRVGLIIFDDDSQIISHFTSDKDELVNQIASLSETGCTNYYQALVNVDNILKGYKKEENRECIVLFLTDGYPNVDTPNEVVQYDYLKRQYPFITINGIQYEMGSSVLEQIKKVSDNQFIAYMETLSNILFDAAVVPTIYDNFEIIDYIDTNYVYVESEKDINVSQGDVSFNREKQEFTWKINDLRSGMKSKMKIKAKLKDEFVGKGGLYSTNEKEVVKSKIIDVLENVESFETPILTDKYEVVYDGNEPNGCRVEGVPLEKEYSVFDTVEISDSVPKCEGYKFKEWKIITKNVNKINDDYFIMPEKNVELRAVWSKLDIKKSINGTVNEKASLYEQVKHDYENNNNARRYSGATSTFNGKKDVYYYYGDTPNNNVIFGGFCWRMYRTTDTGRVKIVYNGEPDSEGKCGTNRDNHIGYSPITSQSLAANYSYGTDYVYDDTTSTFTLSGSIEDAIWSEATSTNLIGKYTCLNTGGSCSTLYLVESYNSNSSANVFPLNNDTVYSQVGMSRFSNDYLSLADAGYMYNKKYTSSFLNASNISPSTSISILSKYSLSTSYYYGDGVEWNSTNNQYVLENPSIVTDYSNLVGKYTFRNNSENYSDDSVYYISGIDDDYMYCITLSNGQNLAQADRSYTVSDSFIDDGTGKKILDPTTAKAFKITEWFNEYEKYKGKYYWTTASCDQVYNVTWTSNTTMNIVSIENNFMYGNSFTYDKDTGMYTLSGKTQHFTNWYSNYNKLRNTHYTCWNSSGTCSKISYIYILFKQIRLHIRHHI
ncbi:MAG: VWA domain-containing protein [Bacilli bacterium]|nr:VWA domain-containing protein [Bacilli bacterium]